MFRRSLAKFVAVTVMLVLVCYVAEAQYVQDGLLGYWSFDADTIDGKTVSDSSGNGNHAEANFDLEMVEGKIGDALLFGEVDGNRLTTELMVTEAQFESLTMMAWAKPNMVHPSWGSVMDCDDGGWDRGYGYRANNWEIQVGQGGEWQPGDEAEVDVWQHTVVIYTPTDVIWYHDGQRNEWGKRTVPTTSGNPLVIGGDVACGPTCVFHGPIDEVLVYGRELTDAEVTQNFEAEGAAVGSAGKLSLTWGAIKALK